MTEQTLTALTADEFGNFFSEYKSHFVHIAFSYVHDMDTAKDIVTDSFIYLWERRGEVTWGENIKGYVYFTVKNRCLSYLREQQALIKVTDAISKAERWKIQSGIDSLSNDELSKKLFQSEILAIFMDELARMPELTRLIFTASRQEDMTYQQIAEKYGVSVRKVTSEIQRALEQLRIPLKDYLGLALVVFSCMKKM